MAKKIICVILTAMLLSITVYADVLAPAMNSPTKIALLADTNGIYVKRTFGPNDTAHNVFDRNYPSSAYGIWMSNMYAETIYKMTLQVQNWAGNVGETGFMQHSDDFAMYLIPAEYLLTGLDLSPEKYGTDQRVWTSWSSFADYRLPDEQYEIFWDRTSKQLSFLFYNTGVATNAYVVARLGTWTEGAAENLAIKAEITQGAQGIYTDILQDIKQILQESTGGGAGLTQDQIDQAVQDALIAHEQWQDNQGNQMIGDAEETLEEHFGQYFDAADEIRQSLSGISDALSYSGTDGVLVLPEARNPMADNALLWTRKEIDLVAAWNGIPQALRSVVSIVVTMSILTAIAKEVLSILEMWNTEKDLFGR